MHPSWEIKMWNYSNLFPLYNQKRFDQTNLLKQKSDIARYEIIFQYGGVYLDVDFEPLKTIEPLLHGIKAFVAWESKEFVCNGVFGGIPGHEFIKDLVLDLDSNWMTFVNGTVNQQTGPHYMTKHLKKTKLTMESGFQAFPTHIFFPYPWYQDDPGFYNPLSFAVHHFSGMNRKKVLIHDSQK
ncbi:unnamed protein product [Didymodactylos carnosus]|uniref:Glycosyltransferase n=1 Tax=Didymodactylos carnosus TaxID=1234261 RepID=A0A815ZNZ2_9BILA|nr:unnamed protein product [Didymodactylos carnosus]CAF1585654.1 unnamed protein product [Didymodactylos carnosus]CAF3862095.1 unnamed protein product [Didymodactylos carnosus]CAF4455134.1 unnamed protein product [Didymodactylos carnosus]